MKTKLSLLLTIITLTSSIAVCEEPDSYAKKFIITGWIPYWRKSQGCDIVKSKLHFFNELSPFAFEVQPDGSLTDTAETNTTPWTDLLPMAQDNKILILPTILWTDSKAIHTILGSAAARKQHISKIIDLIETKIFDGIDIDYEGKDASDKDIFSVFITELSTALKIKGYYLSCTIETRTSDYPIDGWKQTRAMAWANDFSILNKYCDEVRIMAYDQPFQTKGAKEWQDNSEYPYAANADILWVEEVIKYALQKISPGKLVLGIPTYGWEFIIKGNAKNWAYKRFKSTTYPQAVETAKSHSLIPKRDKSGELSFIYEANGEKHLVYFPDSESIRQKIQLAKKYKLAGIVFFKLDGLEDKKMWETLKEELTAKQEKFLIVTDQAANIRKEPISAAMGYAHDDLQETQVLYNEILVFKDESNGWYKVEAVEQPEFSHFNKWQGYPGWVEKKSVKPAEEIPKYNSVVKSKSAKIYSSLMPNRQVLLTVPIGVRFKIIGKQGKYFRVELADNNTGWIKQKDLTDYTVKFSDEKVRANILSTARLFLKVPYLWGGRSMLMPSNGTAAGVDCSGLTNLAYRVNNIRVPRDAYEQWLSCERICAADLKPADLIFISAENNFDKITHVMLYLKGEYFIESSGTGNRVDIKTFKKKFGIKLCKLINRDYVINNKKIYFGRVNFNNTKI